MNDQTAVSFLIPHKMTGVHRQPASIPALLVTHSDFLLGNYLLNPYSVFLKKGNQSLMSSEKAGRQISKANN